MKPSLFSLSIALLGLSAFTLGLSQSAVAQFVVAQSNGIEEIGMGNTLTVRPQNMVQGQQLLVRLAGLSSAKALSAPLMVHVAGKQVPMTPSKNVYEAYVALPGDQKPGGYTLQVKSGFTVLATQKIEVVPGRFGLQNIRYAAPPINAELKKKLDVEYALIDTARESYTPQKLWSGPFILPIPHRISSVYGTRRQLNGKYNGYHGGVDFASPMGYPIKAPAHGKVVLASYFSVGNDNGNTVFLDHGMGVTTGFIHLSKISVKVGDIVQQGQTIGLIGTTGRSTGPHLHWGTYIHGQNTDGLGWIRLTQQ